jgi:membrane protein implicated in regulation of membrane protease activity
MNLPDWFQDWQAWLGLAIVLGVAELFSLDLILLMLAVGALAGMLGAVLGLGVGVQVLLAVAASVGMLAAVRPGVVKRLHAGPDLVQGHAKLVGRQGVVVSEVTSEGGRVRIGGELWSACAYDQDQVIEPGARVDVFEIRGATAVVYKIPELDS